MKAANEIIEVVVAAVDDTRQGVGLQPGDKQWWSDGWGSKSAVAGRAMDGSRSTTVVGWMTIRVGPQQFTFSVILFDFLSLCVLTSLF